MTEFQQIIEDMQAQLSNIKYIEGDLSDIGNEIGIVIAKYIKIDDKEYGFKKDDFITGLNHGISLVDGTHP